MAYSGSELSEMLESESELVEELPRNTTESQAPQPQFDLVDDSAINSSGLGETDTSEIHPVNLNKAAEDDVTNQQYSEVLSEISSAGESSGIGASEVQSSSPGDYQDVVEEDNDEVDSEDQSSGSTLDRSEENEVSGPAAGREALQYVTPKKEDGEGTRRKFLSKLPSMKRSLRRFSSAQDLRTSDGENLSDKIKLSRRRKSFSFFKSTESTPKSAQSSRRKLRSLSGQLVRYFKPRSLSKTDKETKTDAKKEADQEQRRHSAEEATAAKRPSLQRKLSFSVGAKSLLRKLSSGRLLGLQRKLNKSSGAQKNEVEDEEEDGSYYSDQSNEEVTGFEHLFYSQVMQRLTKVWKSDTSLFEKLAVALAPIGLLVTLLARLAVDIERQFAKDLAKQEQAFYSVCGLMHMGSTEDKSAFLYRLCDIDGDGAVSRHDFKKVLTEIAWSNANHVEKMKENMGANSAPLEESQDMVMMKLSVFFIMNDPTRLPKLEKLMHKYEGKEDQLVTSLLKKHGKKELLNDSEIASLRAVAASINHGLDDAFKGRKVLDFAAFLSWISADLQDAAKLHIKSDYLSLCPAPEWDYPVQELEDFPVRVCSARASDVRKINGLRFRRRTINLGDGKLNIVRGKEELFHVDLLDNRTEIELVVRPGHRHAETIYLRSQETELFLQSSSTAPNKTMAEVLQILKVNTHEAYLPREYSDYSDRSYDEEQE